MKEKSRFDLEQEIMGCWNVVDELKLLVDKWDSITEDDKLNIIIGMASLYQLKFDIMFNTFEDCVHRREFKNKFFNESTTDDE